MKRTFIHLNRVAVLAAVSLGLGHSALAGQPHMDAALQNLLAARAELEQAYRKHGERDAAIAAVDRAIAEVRAGEAFQAERAQAGKGNKRKAR